MSKQPFTKDDRLLRGGQFQRVYKRRCSVADDVLIVYGCVNNCQHPRLGLTVSRKIGSAVVRNRWKRVIREAFRQSRESLPADIDLVITPRRDAQASLAKVSSSLVSLTRRVDRKLRRSDRQTSEPGPAKS